MVNGLSLILYKGSKCFLTTSPIHPITHAFMLLFLSVPTLWLADWRNQRSTHHTGTWNHVSIIYGIASTTFSSAHSALFSVSCFFSTFLLYPSLFSSYQPLSVSQQSPGLELFLNMSEWIEGQWVCKRTHRHTLHNTMMPWHSRNVCEPIGNSRVWEMNEWKEDGYLMRASGVDKGRGGRERKAEKLGNANRLLFEIMYFCSL